MINEFLSSISRTHVDIMAGSYQDDEDIDKKKKIYRDPNRPKKPADVLAVFINDQKKQRK